MTRALFLVAMILFARGAAAAEPSTKTAPPKIRVVHAVARTEMHLNPAGGSPMLEVIEPGETIDFGGLSRDGAWARVRTALGTVGWIPKRDLRPGPAPAAIPTPAPPRRGPLEVRGEAAYVLIDERVSSREGHGYAAKIGGYGAGVRVERELRENLVLEGGYLGSANQRMPAPQSRATVFSTLHRVDVGARYGTRFDAPGEPGVFAIAGLQNHSFLVQPQDLSWFYSQIYTSAAIGAGAEGRSGRWSFGGDARWLGPVLASERYGNGGAGGDGQRSASTGYALRAGARYETARGGTLGVSWTGSFFDTRYTGTGRRGPNEITGARVRDSFQAVSVGFSRGF